MAEDDFEADDVGEDIPVDPSLLDSDEKLPKDPLPLRDERRDVECGDEGAGGGDDGDDGRSICPAFLLSFRRLYS